LTQWRPPRAPVDLPPFLPKTLRNCGIFAQRSAAVPGRDAPGIPFALPRCRLS